jgi:hypothetical protein
LVFVENQCQLLRSAYPALDNYCIQRDYTSCSGYHAFTDCCYHRHCSVRGGCVRVQVPLWEVRSPYALHAVRL